MIPQNKDNEVSLLVFIGFLTSANNNQIGISYQGNKKTRQTRVRNSANIKIQQI